LRLPGPGLLPGAQLLVVLAVLVDVARGSLLQLLIWQQNAEQTCWCQ
jgi:hypothetical protein